MIITKTRAAMFETNSSSTHAVSVSTEKFEANKYDLAPGKDGALRIFPGEFGWGPEHYNDAKTKASYLLTWCWDRDNAESLQQLARVIKSVCKIEPRFCMIANEFYPRGYIDHQSSDIASHVFSGGDKAIKSFIFNPKSWLIIDNDNR